MKHTPTKQLEVKIQARNKLNWYILDRAPVIFESMQPWVGKKVQLATGLTSKAFKESMPELRHDHEIRAFIRMDKYAVYLNAEASAWVPGHGPHSTDIQARQESSLRLADLDQSGFLGKLYPELIDLSNPSNAQWWRTDYTAEMVCQTRADIDLAEYVVNELKKKIAHFGSQDYR